MMRYLLELTANHPRQAVKKSCSCQRRGLNLFDVTEFKPSSAPRSQQKDLIQSMLRSLDAGSKADAKQLDKLADAASSKAKQHMDLVNTSLKLAFERQQQARGRAEI